MTEQQTQLLEEAFDRWWINDGCEMAPLPGHDHEAHARRIARIAWHNGAYVKLHHIQPPTTS